MDKNKTSSYEIYQFLINAEDSKVIDYLKIYTFLTKEEIEKIEKQHFEKPELRLAQKELARGIITFLHGEEEYQKALHISEALFNGNIKELSYEEIQDAFKNIPSFKTDELSLLDLLVNNNIASSRREARELIQAGSITINGDVYKDEAEIIDKNKAMYNEILIIRRGKKKYYVGIFK